MRIAVWHNLPSGGGKRALYSQVAELILRGHSLESWTTDASDPDFLPLSELAPEHRMPFQPKPSRKKTRWERIRFPLALEDNGVLGEMDRHSAHCAEEIL